MYQFIISEKWFMQLVLEVHGKTQGLALSFPFRCSMVENAFILVLTRNCGAFSNAIHWAVKQFDGNFYHSSYFTNC